MSRLSEEELEELLSHGSWIRPLARRLLYDPSAADDVVQEVYLTAMNRPPRDAAALPAWLHKVTRTLSFRANRSVRRRRRHEQQTPQPRVQITPEQIEQQSETQSIVAAEIARLDEPYRTVVYLRFYEDQKFDHIAEQLGMPSSTVRNHSQRATQLLRTRLESRLGKRNLLIALTGVLGMSEWSSAGAIGFSGGDRFGENRLETGAFDEFEDDEPLEASPGSATGILSTTAALILLGVIAWSGFGGPQGTAGSSSGNSPIAASPPQSPVMAALESGALGSGMLKNTAEPAPAEETSTATTTTVATISPEELPGTVVVLDRDGAPVAGAHVALFTRDQPTPAILQVTDSEGIAEVPRHSLTQDRLVIVAHGALEYREPLSRRTLEDGRYTVELAEAREIAVRVVDREGLPIAGATVDWIPRPPFLLPDEHDPAIARAESNATDGGGTATFFERHRRNEVRVEAKGYEPVARFAHAPLTEITLIAGQPLQARVVDGQGVGVAHCALRLRDLSTAHPTQDEIPRSFETDARGFVDFGVIDLERERIVDLFPRDLPSLRVTGHPPESGVWEFMLPDGITLEGRVFGPDGEGVERGFVFFALPEAPPAASGDSGEEVPSQLNTPDAGSSPTRHRLKPKVRARIGPGGAYTLGPIPAKHALSGFLFVAHPTLENELRDWPRGNLDEAIDFHLTSGTRVEGHATTIDGEPAAGATLFLGEVWRVDAHDPPYELENVVGRARVAADGSFQFEGVPAEVSEENARATRARLFLKAFRPDLLLEVEGGDPLPSIVRDGFEIDPARESKLALTLGTASQVEEFRFSLTAWDGNAPGQWLPTVRIGVEGEARFGAIGSAGEATRLHSEHAPKSRAAWLLVASDRFGWLEIPAQTSVTQALPRRAAENTRIEVRDAAAPDARFHLYVGVPFGDPRPQNCVLLGTTDATGAFGTTAVSDRRGTLFAARVTGDPPDRVRATRGGDQPSESEDALFLLGAIDFRPGSLWTLPLPSPDLTR